MKFIFRLFLNLSSISLIGTLYFVHHHFEQRTFSLTYDFQFLMIIVFTPLCISIICIWLSRKLSMETIRGATSLEIATNTILPTFLGYFFVGLSINNLPSFIFVFLLIFIFTFTSQTFFFNPMLLLFGYSYYYVNNSKGRRILIITRTKLIDELCIESVNFNRINDNTFIEAFSWR